MIVYTAEDISLALDRDEIFALFQPQIDVATGMVVGAEALSRWNRPGEGLIMPADYIGSAESTGAILELDRRMLVLGCMAAARWRGDGLEIGVSVNLAATSFLSEGLLDHLADCLSLVGLPARAVTLEITESQRIDDLAAARAVVDALVSQGVRVSLDDFGTGFADEALLDGLPVAELKLDRTLLQDDPQAAAAGAALAHARGLLLVAEGVENESHLALCRELACDRVQGFLFADALTADELHAFAAPVGSARRLF